jgi:limonene-1,2-epoxide hydrolase
MTDELPIDTVRRFCAAWADSDLGDLGDLMAFFAEDAVYHNIPVAPVTGREQIRSTIEGFSTGVESVEFRVDAIAADGGTVLTERLDVFIFPNGRIELPVMGTFEVADGLITAWRDYFDMNQFLSQIPQ